MKMFMVAVGVSLSVGVVGCNVRQPPPTFADRFAEVETLMAQADVQATLGPPTNVRIETFPEGQFMGPQEGMIGVIAPAQPYAQWEYLVDGNVYLVFFAGQKDDAPQNQWTVVGKTEYPQGAVF